MITAEEIFEINETNEDIYEFVSSLFSLEEKVLLQNELSPLVRLEKLNFIREKVFKQAYNESEERFDNAIKATSRNYLIRIFQDFLNIDIYELDKTRDLADNIFCLIQKKINYFDTIDKSLKLKKISLKELFKDEKEFNYTFLSGESVGYKKRNLILREAFSNNSKRYLQVFKEKLFLASAIIYKQILFLELQKLNYDEIARILVYLMHTSSDYTYIELNNDQSKNAELFFKSSYWGELLTKDQRSFYSSVQSIFNKLQKHDFSEGALTEHNKDIVETLLWLKSSPKESLQTLEIVGDLYERDNLFALNVPTNLILYLDEVKEKLCRLVKNPRIQFSDKKISDLTYTGEMLIAKTFCDSVTEKVCNICHAVLHAESSLVKDIIKAKTNKKLKEIVKKLFYIILVIIFLTILKITVIPLIAY